MCNKLLYLIELCAALFSRGKQMVECIEKKSVSQINKRKTNKRTTSDAALNLGFESSAVFKQANYMNYELHDCYAHKFINYEIFGASFAILLCSRKVFRNSYFGG